MGRDAVKITADMKKPPNPSNGFFIFRSKFLQATDMPKNNISDVAAISKECGELWRGLSELEKQVRLLPFPLFSNL
jgi:hypothetical protein